MRLLHSKVYKMLPSEERPADNLIDLLSAESALGIKSGCADKHGCRYSKI